MKWAILTFTALAIGLDILYVVFGWRSAYQVGYGSVAVMGLAIAATFLWLWWVKATPLALGMALSWAGSAAVMGWWWSFDVLNFPNAMLENRFLLAFVALYTTGAIMHFHVIQQSMALPRYFSTLPVAFAILVSAFIWVLTG